ncbi:hypothetical protein [Streptomyces sp. NRRL WC-3618]|uniref:hypothetical protein n=1 Tax=Streptomyces sp. NRRL WC-3618 TaxID=1519490 RepID=UPI000AB816B3|nr:hypothetical protein [Streptomyces sp. NRRL WC-3618]
MSAFHNFANGCDTNSPPDSPDADGPDETRYKQYWWRGSKVTWKSNRPHDCGNENIKYQTLISEPRRGCRLQHGAPACSTTGLPQRHGPHRRAHALRKGPSG